MLGGFCTLARDTGAVNHMLRGPWVWAAVDGPVCEALAKFETVSTPGNSTPQFESWGAKLGNALISAPGGGADPFSALRKRHIASALLVKRPHVFNTPWDIRCTSAWSATDAAEAYHGALSSFIGMPGNGMPATPPAADDKQFWDLVWWDRYASFGRGIQLKVVRIEWKVDLTATGLEVFNKDLITLFEDLNNAPPAVPPGFTGAFYKAGTAIRLRQDSGATDPRTTYQVLAAFDRDADDETIVGGVHWPNITQHVDAALLNAPISTYAAMKTPGVEHWEIRTNFVK